MRRRTALVAWAMGGLSAGLALAAVVLAGRNGESLSELVFNHHAIGIVSAIGLAVLGALIAGRRPGNPIGWLMSVGALFLGVFSFTQQYAPLAVAESLPGVDLASWLAAWTNLPGIAITITFVFQLFPDGRPPSPRWRPVVWLTAAATVVPTAVLAARAWPVRGPALAVESFEHPALGDAFGTGFLLVLALSVVSLAALVVRFRRSAGTERQQIKWFAYGAMIGIPLGLPAEVPFWGPILELLQPPLMFTGLGIGMFRYRLYDIDRLLNRTLVYGLADRLAGRRVRRRRAPPGRHGQRRAHQQPGRGRRHPGRGRHLPAAPPRHPAGRRPPLQPARLRRRGHHRGVRGPAAPAGRPRRAPGRAAGPGRPDGPADPGLALAAADPPGHPFVTKG